MDNHLLISLAPILKEEATFVKTKENGTEIGHSLEFDFVVPLPHS